MASAKSMSCQYLDEEDLKVPEGEEVPKVTPRLKLMKQQLSQMEEGEASSATQPSNKVSHLVPRAPH